MSADVGAIKVRTAQGRTWFISKKNHLKADELLGEGMCCAVVRNSELCAVEKVHDAVIVGVVCAVTENLRFLALTKIVLQFHSGEQASHDSPN